MIRNQINLFDDEKIEEIDALEEESDIDIDQYYIDIYILEPE